MTDESMERQGTPPAAEGGGPIELRAWYDYLAAEFPGHEALRKHRLCRHSEGDHWDGQATKAERG